MQHVVAVAAQSGPSFGVAAIGGLVAGAMLTGMGLWQRRTVQRLVADGRRTTASAVDSVLHHADHGGAAHHHIVWRFQTEDGTAVEHEGLASGFHVPAEGQTARIIYDPADPHNARLETFAERTLAWAIFLYSGVGLLIAAVVAIAVDTW